jgi:uncharacterized membrane protein
MSDPNNPSVYVTPNGSGMDMSIRFDPYTGEPMQNSSTMNATMNQSYFDASLAYSVPDVKASNNPSQTSIYVEEPRPPNFYVPPTYSTPQNMPPQQQLNPAQPPTYYETPDQHTEGFIGSPDATSTGASPLLLGILCYLFSWLGALIIFLLERRNLFIVFHSIQSMLASAIFFVFWLVFVWQWVVFWLFWSISMAFLVFMVIKVAIDAPKQKLFKLPLIGKFAKKRAKFHIGARSMK